MENTPLVSVVITTYNCSRFIEETVNSVIEQSYTNFEIIIADDGSSDSTQDVTKTLAKKESRIKFIPLEHSGSPAKTRNAAIDVASGKYTAFLDGDDIWVKGKLELQVNLLEKMTSSVLCYGMSVTFGDVNVFSPYYEVLPLLNRGAYKRDDLIYKGNVITNSSVLVRTEALKSSGGYDEDPQMKIEDYDLWIRLGEMGDYAFIPKILVRYRVHGNQFSGSWEIKQANLRYLAKKRNLPIPDYKFYRNKGLLWKLVRNAIHFLNYLVAKE